MKNILIGAVIIALLVIVVVSFNDNEQDIVVEENESSTNVDTDTSVDTAELSMNSAVAGASAVYYSADAGKVFLSSNTESMVTVFDTASMNKTTSPVEAADADGMHYDADTQMLYQVNRSSNQIDAYSWTDGQFVYEYSSVADEFSNGRELAVADTMLVVAQDANDANGNQNALAVFEMADGAINYIGTRNVSVNLWGIRSAEDDLHAIVDNSSNVAVFADFFTTDHTSGGALEADMVIEVAGITRTHGLDYDADTDVMVLTDIGSADADDDGGLVVVTGFMDAAADGMIQADEQMRIAGSDTMLGNPVDVALDYANRMVYVAERANGGGQMLAFTIPE